MPDAVPSIAAAGRYVGHQRPFCPQWTGVEVYLELTRNAYLLSLILLAATQL